MLDGSCIRAAEAKDEAGILVIATDFAASFLVEKAAFRRSFEELLSTAHALVAVAEVEGQVVGYVLGFAHATFYANGPVAWVEEIAVLPAFRNKGVGKRLMHHFEEWAREQGCKLVAVATRRAKAFYETLGFEPSADYYRKLL